MTELENKNLASKLYNLKNFLSHGIQKMIFFDLFDKCGPKNWIFWEFFENFFIFDTFEEKTFLDNEENWQINRKVALEWIWHWVLNKLKSFLSHGFQKNDFFLIWKRFSSVNFAKVSTFWSKIAFYTFWRSCVNLLNHIFNVFW